MKRILALLIVLSLCMGFNVSAENSQNKLIAEFIEYTNNLDDEFSDWSKSDFKEYVLYNHDLVETGILYEHKKGDGYFIYDSEIDTISEFSTKPSPYSEQLDNFKVAKKITGNKIKKEYLIYDGISCYSYVIETDEGLEYYNEFDYAEVYLSGVGDNSYYLGCSPTAGSNIIAFWDINGYIDLIDGLTVNQVIAHLAVFMDTDSSGGTNRADIAPGIVDYCEYMGYNNFSYGIKNAPSFSQCKYEVDQGRPAIVSIDNEVSFPTTSHPYGNHSVTLVGYDETYGNDYIIIHDGWASTSPAKTYYIFSSKCAVLHKIYD